MRSKYFTLILALLLCGTLQAQEASKKTINNFYSQIEKYMNFPNSFFELDRLTSVVNFEIEVDAEGIIKERKIIEPVLHQGHARHFENVLRRLDKLPGNGKTQIFRSSIDYADYVPKSLKKKVEAIETVVAPTYNAGEDIEKWFCELLSEQERLDLFVDNRTPRVLVKVLHKKNGSLYDVSLAHISTNNLLRVFLGDKLKELSKGWSPAQVNGKAHDYYATYEINIKNTLSPQVVKDAIAMSKKPNQPFMVSEVMPKFQGGDITYFRSWFSAKYTERLREELGAYWYTKIQGGTIIVKFIVGKDGSAVLTDVTRSKMPEEDMVLVGIISRLIAETEWTPGIQRGKNVRVRFNMPLTLNLK